MARAQGPQSEGLGSTSWSQPILNKQDRDRAAEAATFNASEIGERLGSDTRGAFCVSRSTQFEETRPAEALTIDGTSPMQLSHVA